MKNLIAFAMVLMFAFTFSLHAIADGGKEPQSKNPISVTTVSSGLYHLEYASENEENIRLTIFNEKGKAVLTEFYKNKKGIAISYDLNELPQGKYSFKIMANSKAYTTTINHEKAPAPFFKSYLAPEKDKNKYSLTVVRHSAEPVTVTILDKYNRVIFTENIETDLNFRRFYDLKAISLDAKSISVQCGDTTREHML